MYITRNTPTYRLTNKSLHIDFTLLYLILALSALGFIILWSASGANLSMLARQGFRLALALSFMTILSFIPPHRYKHITPWIYTIGLILLFAVMILGSVSKGAQRWLNLGLFKFQPSEMMKIAVPMMSAFILEKYPSPLTLKPLLLTLTAILVPSILIAKQPDLGTALMVMASSLCIVLVAGLNMRMIIISFSTVIVAIPVLWHIMHDYQKKRIFTLLNPESDPLGSGYHIIQSKIAIGSGGISGKGWLLGTQAHLNFLPEHATDFIFAVYAEEFGFIGSILMIILVFLITYKCLMIMKNSQTRYTELLAASLSMSFFLSAFVNMGMVMGILPVVGIPLPLISYGGTAMVTFFAGFGILMSISTHKILFRHNNVI